MYLELIQKSKKCKQNQKIKKLFIHKKANTDDSELSKMDMTVNSQKMDMFIINKTWTDKHFKQLNTQKKIIKMKLSWKKKNNSLKWKHTIQTYKMWIILSMDGLNQYNRLKLNENLLYAYNAGVRI